MTVVQNLSQLNQRMRNVALRCGRNPEEIRLVAVSKTVSVEKVKEAIAAGVTILGENYIQEARGEISLISQKVQWHFIGHLQSNKAKYAVLLFDMIHSVDSMPLAEELNKEARKLDKLLPVLIQVNISGEKTKAGVKPEQAFSLLEEISLLDNLSVQGLMTMPPWFENPEDARRYFAALRKLREELVSKKLERVNLKELSMGMSGDFEVAIEEGATLVRIGTAIFGRRG